jgi:hypothetical protein
MLELNAISFLGAATQIARLQEIVQRSSPDSHKDLLLPATVTAISPMISAFKSECEKVGARLAALAADRLLARVNETPCRVLWGDIIPAVTDLESRFADHLLSVKFFAISDQEGMFFEPADSLVEIEGFATKFPKASFEIEEAAKCMALGRHTATVFHAMRMLELGIKALAARLEIPDPTTPAERNWATILKAIKDKIDLDWPSKKRMPGTEGSKFELLYAHLDAVRNPWRNATMHVETIYAPHEAIHILRCSAFFMKALLELSDEDGNAHS